MSRPDSPAAAPSTTAADVFGGVRAAFMLLTRLPFGGETSVRARQLASGWFPLVGAVVGALAAAGFALAAPALGGFVAAVLALALLALVTGALHEDGLADTADALGGARDRAQIFVILKDPRHGTFAVLALLLVTLARLGALVRLGAHAPAALLFTAVASRTAMVYLLGALPYVTPPATARSGDVARAPRGAMALATALAGAAAAALISLGALEARAVAIGAAALAAAALLAGWRFHVRAGGITGDFLGAAQQLCDAAALLALAAALA